MPHILLPTDFSDASLNAVRFAITHFGGARTTFTLVHSFLEPRLDDTLLPEITGIARKQAVRAMAAFERKCRKLDDNALFRRSVEPTWLPDAINDVVHDQGADLVILGSQGTGMNMIYGSMAVEVVRKVELPVLVVPGEWVPGPIKRIMLTHDGGPMNGPTLAPLLQFAKRKKAEVVVTHVRGNSISMDAGMDRQAVKELLPGLHVTFVTVQGDSVASTIDEVAAEGRIQLVAAIHRKRGFWKGLLHRSRTKRMALHTHVPLLVLR